MIVHHWVTGIVGVHVAYRLERPERAVSHVVKTAHLLQIALPYIRLPGNNLPDQVGIIEKGENFRLIRIDLIAAGEYELYVVFPENPGQQAKHSGRFREDNSMLIERLMTAHYGDDDLGWRVYITGGRSFERALSQDSTVACPYYPKAILRHRVELRLVGWRIANSERLVA
jgi:hypothetical protein